jgi:hypothetical protein
MNRISLRVDASKRANGTFVCVSASASQAAKQAAAYQEHALGRPPAVTRRSSLRKIHLIHSIPDACYIRFCMTTGERYISIGIDTRGYSAIAKRGVFRSAKKREKGK